jgi:hypothetical protein
MTDVAMQDVSVPGATVLLAAEGDEVAFARLVHAHHASMARVAYVICGDAEDGRVLFYGGVVRSPDRTDPEPVLAEVFDPATSSAPG